MAQITCLISHVTCHMCAQQQQSRGRLHTAARVVAGEVVARAWDWVVVGEAAAKAWDWVVVGEDLGVGVGWEGAAAGLVVVVAEVVGAWEMAGVVGPGAGAGGWAAMAMAAVGSLRLLSSTAYLLCCSVCSPYT